MKKRNLTTLIVIFLILLVSSLCAEKNNLQILITAGRSISYSEYNPKSMYYYYKTYYNSPNYGIFVKWKKHIVSFNLKKFNNNSNILECEVSNKVTGKEFLVTTIVYGRQIYQLADFKLNVFTGVGYLERKVNRHQSTPDISSKNEEIILPLKLTLNKILFKKFGVNISTFCDLNFEEIIYGLEINLLLRLI